MFVSGVRKSKIFVMSFFATRTFSYSLNANVMQSLTMGDLMVLECDPKPLKSTGRHEFF